MYYLLDTYALIWMLSSPSELSERARFAILQADKIYVSFASLWEISIKQGNGKLDFRKSIKEIADVCQKTNIHILYPTPSELDVIRQLPKIHGDPFDRLIVAQAQVRGLTIITSDIFIPKYQVPVLW